MPRKTRGKAEKKKKKTKAGARERRTLQQPCRKQTPTGGSKIAISISQKISQRVAIARENERNAWKRAWSLNCEENKRNEGLKSHSHPVRVVGKRQADPTSA